MDVSKGLSVSRKNELLPVCPRIRLFLSSGGVLLSIRTVLIILIAENFSPVSVQRSCISQKKTQIMMIWIRNNVAVELTRSRPLIVPGRNLSKFMFYFCCETIPAAPYGFNNILTVCRFSKLFTQSADQSVNGSVKNLSCTPTCQIQKLIPGKSFWRMHQECQQQVVFRCRKSNKSTIRKLFIFT